VVLFAVQDCIDVASVGDLIEVKAEAVTVNVELTAGWNADDAFGKGGIASIRDGQ